MTPYLLDFLGLEDAYSEHDLEAAILRELERFLQELGTDFGFIARQKRMTIGNKDFYLDLLFYHRSLRSLVVVDLKLGSFDAAYKGQMGSLGFRSRRPPAHSLMSSGPSVRLYVFSSSIQNPQVSYDLFDHEVYIISR